MPDPKEQNERAVRDLLAAALAFNDTWVDVIAGKIPVPPGYELGPRPPGGDVAFIIAKPPTPDKVSAMALAGLARYITDYLMHARRVGAPEALVTDALLQFAAVAQDTFSKFVELAGYVARERRAAQGGGMFS